LQRFESLTRLSRSWAEMIGYIEHIWYALIEVVKHLVRSYILKIPVSCKQDAQRPTCPITKATATSFRRLRTLGISLISHKQGLEIGRRGVLR
jgi:hypothetical protein